MPLVYVHVLVERRLALKPFRSHRLLHWSLNYCITWPDSNKSNMHEPYQDLWRGLGSHKTAFKPPRNVITNRSNAMFLVRLISNEFQLSLCSIYEGCSRNPITLLLLLEFS